MLASRTLAEAPTPGTVADLLDDLVGDAVGQGCLQCRAHGLDAVGHGYREGRLHPRREGRRMRLRCPGSPRRGSPGGRRSHRWWTAESAPVRRTKAFRLVRSEEAHGDLRYLEGPSPGKSGLGCARTPPTALPILPARAGPASPSIIAGKSISPCSMSLITMLLVSNHSSSPSTCSEELAHRDPLGSPPLVWALGPPLLDGVAPRDTRPGGLARCSLTSGSISLAVSLV